MASGLDLTFAVLRRTANETAVDVLAAALDSPHAAVREGAARALAAGRHAAGHRLLLERWDKLDDRCRAAAGERPGRLTGAIRDALVSGDGALAARACDAAVWAAEYDLFPILVSAAAEKSGALGELAAGTVVRLAERLEEEIDRPADGRRRRDPQRVRGFALSSLQGYVERFPRGGRSELLEAFLTLASPGNQTVRRVLGDPKHPAFLSLLETLGRSQRPGVVRLAVRFLEASQPPTAALQTLARRTDRACVQRLLQHAARGLSPRAERNVRRLEAIAWVSEPPEWLWELDDALQAAALRLATASRTKRAEALRFVRLALDRGGVKTRRAAAAALAEFNGSEANQLVLRCVRDEDPQVQAAVLPWLRRRGIPGALTLLIERIDSPAPAVRAAARKSLAEFNYRRYLAAYDLLDERARASAGRLVRKVDPHAAALLREELQARSRTRRLRALKTAPHIDAVRETEDVIVELLGDSDHFVRAEAARALGASDSARAKRALAAALNDRSVMVREAAAESLRSLAAAAGEGAETKRLAEEREQ